MYINQAMVDKQTTVRNISWSEVEDLIAKISLELGLRGKKYVTGIPRGGVIPAVLISHKAGLCYISYDLFESMDEGEKQEVLVVDDISDSGTTTQPLVDRGYTVVTLCHKETCQTQITFYGMITGRYDWIRFPWESSGSKMVAGYLEAGV